MHNDDEIIAEIRSQLPPAKYGLRDFMFSPLYHDPEYGFFVKKDRRDVSDGYECADAALRVRQILRDRGIRSMLVMGKAADSCMIRHIFVTDENDRVWDGTPFYPTLGADHDAMQPLDGQEVEKASSCGRVHLGSNIVPVKWYDEGPCYSHVAASMGATYLISEIPRPKLKPWVASLLALQSDRSRPLGVVEILASIDAPRLKEETTPLTSYDKQASRERIKELERKGIIYTVSRALFYPDNPEIRPLRSDKADMEKVEKLHDNFDVLCSLIEKIPYAYA